MTQKPTTYPSRFALRFALYTLLILSFVPIWTRLPQQKNGIPSVSTLWGALLDTLLMMMRPIDREIYGGIIFFNNLRVALIAVAAGTAVGLLVHWLKWGRHRDKRPGEPG